MVTKDINRLELDVNQGDNFDASREGDTYKHSWDFQADVDGEEIDIRHTIKYSKGQGLIESQVTEVESGIELKCATQEFMGLLNQLNEAAIINLQYYIDNIEK